MMIARRITPLIREDLEKKMVLLSGPRQCGKTTLTRRDLFAGDSKKLAYLNWDFEKDRKLLKSLELPFERSFWVFDEIHKFRSWRNWLKGVYDRYHDEHSILVTGSARLDAYSRGGDSLQGRYYRHRLHPLTLSEAEGLAFAPNQNPFLPRGPTSAKQSTLEQLVRQGGFPEPFLASATDANRWRSSYSELLVQQEVRQLEQVIDLDRMQLLYERLPVYVGTPLSIQAVSEDLEKSHKTIQNWITIFERLYGVFRVPPYGSAKIKAVKKEQKLYFWDWGQVQTEPFRFENCVAVHLMRYCDWMNDTTGEKYELRYYKSVLNQEVDFIILNRGQPVVAVEVKSSDEPIHPALVYFLERTKIPHAFQIAFRGRQNRIETLKGGAKVRLVPALEFLSALP